MGSRGMTRTMIYSFGNRRSVCRCLQTGSSSSAAVTLRTSNDGTPTGSKNCNTVPSPLNMVMSDPECNDQEENYSYHF